MIRTIGPYLSCNSGSFLQNDDPYGKSYEAAYRLVIAARQSNPDNAKLLAEVLTELCELLENYAPSWYTREHHDKAHAALRLLDKRESEE